MMLGSLPSRVKACCTAPIGKPILSILKYFVYSGSSFSAGPSSSSSSSSSLFIWLLSDLLGSRSMMLGSLPSFLSACCTAPIGKPTFSILKYLEYSGSSFNGGSPGGGFTSLFDLSFLSIGVWDGSDSLLEFNSDDSPPDISTELFSSCGTEDGIGAVVLSVFTSISFSALVSF